MQWYVTVIIITFRQIQSNGFVSEDERDEVKT